MIPFSKPDINKEDLKRVENTIKSGWLAHGENSTKLENLFLNFTKSKFCTTVSNCTTGIHAVCMAIGLNSDHEVIVPAQTHVATAHAAAITGAKIKFADVNDLTGNIMLSEIKKLTTKKCQDETLSRDLVCCDNRIPSIATGDCYISPSAQRTCVAGGRCRCCGK